MASSIDKLIGKALDNGMNARLTDHGLHGVLEFIRSQEGRDQSHRGL